MITNIPPFYVGQKVKAVITHAQGYFKKGDVFTVTSVRISCCECIVTIGIRADVHFTECTICKKAILTRTEAEFLPKCFRAITEDFQTISLTKVLEKELVGAN